MCREVFRKNPACDPGRIYYTLIPADVGAARIETTEAVIFLEDVIGRVMPHDVGKRLYRIPDGSGGWLWQCESDGQRDARMSIQQRSEDLGIDSRQVI